LDLFPAVRQLKLGVRNQESRYLEILGEAKMFGGTEMFELKCSDKTEIIFM
jgi:hypothetical protein